jgi:hypothetical protein
MMRATRGQSKLITISVDDAVLETMKSATIGFRSVQSAKRVTAPPPAHPVHLSIALRAMINFAAHANGSGILLVPVAFALSASKSSTDKESKK